MNVTVVTKDDCIQCEHTKKQLDKEEVKYNEINISENKEARELLNALGLSQAPIVLWAGFKIDQIRALGRANALHAG